MVITSGSNTFPVSEIHTDGSLGGLDLVLRYSTATDTRRSGGDPGAQSGIDEGDARRPILKLRDGFHGLWVFAEAPSQRPYGNELAMSEIH